MQIVLAVEQFSSFRCGLVGLAHIGKKLRMHAADYSIVRIFLYRGIGFLLGLRKIVRGAISVDHLGFRLRSCVRIQFANLPEVFYSLRELLILPVQKS